MLKVALFVCMVMSVLSACCFHRIDLEVFGRSTLDQKLAAYEKAISERCLYSEKGALLRAIAAHGYPAADAMVERLVQPRPQFPIEDAIAALESIHWKGTDLRNHEAMRVLERVAEASPAAAL